jgi:RsiW-degrading membrane proteinase PrsW (M82 family)
VFTDAGEIGYASKILYALAVAFTRLSILLFYYRLSAGTTWTRAYRRFLHGAVAAVVIVCFVQVFMSVFQCRCVLTLRPTSQKTNLHG